MITTNRIAFFRFLLVFHFFMMVAFCPNILAQNKDSENDNPHLVIGIATGITFEGAMFGDENRRNRSRDFMIALEASGPGVFHLDGSRWIPSFEVGYAQIVRISKDFPWEHAPITFRQAPAMGWLTVSTETRLSPFIRGGFGLSWLEYTEKYGDYIPDRITMHRFSFVWGIGGGLQYTIDRQLSIRVLLEDWIATADLTGSTAGGWHQRIKAPHKFTPVGFQFSYHFQ